MSAATAGRGVLLVVLLLELLELLLFVALVVGDGVTAAVAVGVGVAVAKDAVAVDRVRRLAGAAVLGPMVNLCFFFVGALLRLVSNKK